MYGKILGIDTGKDGAGVLLNGSEPLAVFRTKTLLIKGDYQPERMAAMIRSLKAEHGPIACVLEQAAGRGGEGLGSARKIGEGYGLWRGILAALEVPTLTPAPSAWAGVVLKDVPGDDPKARSIQVAMSRLPLLELVPEGCRKIHDGIAQAGCLAIYGQMRGLL